MSSKCGHCIGDYAAASRYQVGAISGRLVMQVILLARIHGQANVKGAARTRKRVSRNVYEHERRGFTSSYDARVQDYEATGVDSGCISRRGRIIFSRPRRLESYS